MRLVLLTPGTGNFHCGSCLHDEALAKALRAQGHDASIVGLYLPLVLDDPAHRDAVDPEPQMGGINLYLQQKSPVFRHTPAFVDRLLERIFARFVPDWIMINEDMSYKEKPMVGPAQSRRFLAGAWRRWADRARAAGVPVIMIDSDGHVGQLIPVWIEAGCNATSPLEVAAGNDLPAYRRTYSEQMAYLGGVDKRAMAAGDKVIEAEMDRLQPVIDAGGYLPSCDHGVPADVSWADYVDYCGLLAEATGWR